MRKATNKSNMSLSERVKRRAEVGKAASAKIARGKQLNWLRCRYSYSKTAACLAEIGLLK